MVPGLQLKLLDTTASNCHIYPYRQVVGSLLYISCATRWDIANAVAYLSKFMKGWDETHWHAAKHLLCYLKGTRGYIILYSRSHYTGPESWHLKFILMLIGQEIKLIANQSPAILVYLQVDRFSGP